MFEQWRLGRADVDDGVLVLVAKDDRAMRIEVGYGLEGAIPDVTAGRIIRDEMVPAFRQGDFAGGIENAVNVLERLIDGEALPEQAQGGGLTREGWLLLIAMLCGAVAGVALRRNLFATRRVVGVSVGLMVLLSFGAGFKTAPLFFMAVSFSMVLGGALGALAAGSRKSACIVGTVVGYIVALSVAASQYGAEVLLYGLGGPIALGLGLALLCLPFILARAAWRRSRLEFFVRLVLASGICVFLMTVTCIVERLGEFPDSLALLPMIYFPLLLAFTRGWAANSGSGSSGGGSSSSGGGGSYSGGGGSSGGGGASGSW
ncbi:TPM domain-containing protein [Pseudomonas sp. LA21]|uniref:TPM domain-containing protein n=1 Tax=Pseudomonas sp. LA21 TaxID=2893373 RepID=UPI001FB5B268|nr:TPM domain-containing protein [Pseudomonas sp. LA21]